MVAPVVGALIAAGVDPGPVLRDVGIDPAQLGSPLARFPDASVQALWLSAPHAAGDPDFGLSAARLYERGMFWILDDLVASAETLGDALECGSRYVRLLHDAASLRLTQVGPLAQLELLPDLPTPIARAQMEFFFACLVLVTRRMTGTYEHPRELHFRHARPASTAQLETFFECPLYFGAERSLVVFPSALLSTPILTADAARRRQLEREAARWSSALGHVFDLTTRVRIHVAQALADGEPQLTAIAKRLAMSGRTLRRKLEGQGTRFSAIVDDVRQRFAARYLLQPDETLDAIAQRLGYAHPEAFFKAHQRWTGITPSELRRARDVAWVGVRALAAEDTSSSEDESNEAQPETTAVRAHPLHRAGSARRRTA
ncbi:MAG TPA: AraC family transcriptional regulator [Polyangiales bacterium]